MGSKTSHTMGMFHFILLVFIFGAYGKNFTRLKLPCQEWQKEYPFENGVLDNCSMTIFEKDVVDVLRLLKSNEYSTELIRFNLRFSEEVMKTKCVVDPHIWTWTFPSPNGAFEFLTWPREYNIWSLGLLNMYSYGPMRIGVNQNGSCPIVIGEKETIQRIGVALLQMVNRSVALPAEFIDIKYGSACYKEKVYIKSNVLYFLCLHVACPIETVGYKCCTAENETSYVCDGKPIIYDNTWWTIPFVIGAIMFVYSPLVLVRIFQRSVITTDNGYPEGLPCVDKSDWLLSNPLTLWSLVQAPFRVTNPKSHRVATITRRILITILTLSIVIIQVVVHRLFDYRLTREYAKHGIPLAFRSMAAGFDLSRENFMPRFGGPFIALGIYLLSTILLICIPNDFQSLLCKGIPQGGKTSMSPLNLDNKTIGKLGSAFNIVEVKGYEKLYQLMTAHSCMILNSEFWKLSLQIQTRRFVKLCQVLIPKGAGAILKIVLAIVLFIFYFTFCVIELALALVYYGLPIFVFFRVLLVSYIFKIKSTSMSASKTLSTILQDFLIILTTSVITFNLYILTVVFIESFLFVSRILIFTFTGFIAYPNTTYGYFVFIITVIIYIAELVHGVQITYSKLFHATLKNCLVLSKRNLIEDKNFLLKIDDFYLIPRRLFLFVVSRIQPVRVKLFYSFLKFVFATFMLYLAIHTIVTLQKQWALSGLTQVITALFVCLVPKVYRMLLVEDEYLKNLHLNASIQRLIVDFQKQNFPVSDPELDD